MATLKYVPQYFLTELNVGGGINDSQTTGIVLQSVSGVNISKPGQICVTYSDPIDTSVAEWINYTSINGSNELVGVTRGAEGFSAHPHLQNATVAFAISASHINDIVDRVNGTNGDLVTDLKATAAEVTTGTEDAKIVTPKNLKDAGIIAPPTKGTGSDITTGTDDAKFVTSKALADATVGKLGAAWTTFDPTITGFTVGNGSKTGSYVQIGKTVHLRVKAVFGSTSSIASSTLSLPIAIKSGAYSTYAEVGVGGAFNGSTIFPLGVTSAGQITYRGVSGSNVININLSSTAPFTWGNGHYFEISITYEAN